MVQSKRILFTESAIVDFGDGPMTYEAGTTYDLREDKAKRWVKRGKAVYVEAQPFCPKTSPVVPALPTEELSPLTELMAKEAEKQELANNAADAEVVVDAPSVELVLSEFGLSNTDPVDAADCINDEDEPAGTSDLSGSSLAQTPAPRRGRPRGSSNRR